MVDALTHLPDLVSGPRSPALHATVLIRCSRCEDTLSNPVFLHRWAHPPIDSIRRIEAHQVIIVAAQGEVTESCHDIIEVTLGLLGLIDGRGRGERSR